MTGPKRPEGRPKGRPEGKRRRSRVTPAVPVHHSDAETLRLFEAAAGGRAALLQRLSYVPDEKLTPETELLVAQLMDPANGQLSLAQICKLSGFTVGRFLHFLKEARGAQALLECYERIYAGLPGVVDGVMSAAQSQQLPCLACEGTGKVKVPTKFTGKRAGQTARVKKSCASCKGTGIISAAAEVERHRLALELGGLSTKKGAPGVQVNVSQSQEQRLQAATFQPSMLASFQAASDRILFQSPQRPELPAAPVRSAELPEPVEALPAPEELELPVTEVVVTSPAVPSHSQPIHAAPPFLRPHAR